MTRSPPTHPGPARDPQDHPSDPHAPPAADPDTLEIAALRERLRLSIERARSTQRTAPLGWLVVGWFAWGRSPTLAIAVWLALFCVALGIVLLVLRRVAERHQDFAWAYPRYVAAIGLDGLAWGSLCPLLMGHDPVLDTWLVTVLCGVAAVNAPVHIMFRRAYGLQLIGMWLPAAGFALLRLREPNMPEMLFGITVFFVLLSVYMGQLGDRIKDNILLSLQKDVLTRQLSDSLARVAMQATTDPLTGRANRRAVDDELQRQQAQLERTRTPFSVLLLDIDHFKQINDQHGHGIGDEALKAFARRVAASLRPSDFLGRYGGEEFVVILPGTPLDPALHVARRVCEAVSAQPLLVQPSLPATVSIGVATCRPGDTARGVLEAADHAVYQAKRSGRNRVCTSQASIATQRQAAPGATQA
jgi:diguanylate cyclase (GGDEF)-like protein